MTKPVSIDLMIKGKKEHFEQTFVPFRKQIEMLKMNQSIEDTKITQAEWLEKKAKFIAGLFDDKRVTADAVLDGLSSATAVDDMENTIAEMLGVDPNEIAEA